MVVKHDLTNMDVDVIVNAADKGLKLEGGLALVIGQKGLLPGQFKIVEFFLRIAIFH